MEVLNLATEALKKLDVDDFRFEIGDSAFFKTLISNITDNEEEIEQIREFVVNKNIPELKIALEKYGDSGYVKAMYALPKLFGSDALKAPFKRGCRAKRDWGLSNVLSRNLPTLHSPLFSRSA